MPLVTGTDGVSVITHLLSAKSRTANMGQLRVTETKVANRGVTRY